MCLSLLPFVGIWVLMMAAMMLPGVAPVASLYTRSFSGRPIGRLALFGLGYLVIWALLGLPAFAVATGVDTISARSPSLVRWEVVGVLLGLAVYQLTPLKQVCLRHCRSPVSELLYYASFRGPARDLRVGAHHGLYCTGCCWPLMVLLIAVGTMNVIAMLALTPIILAEKLLPKGVLISRAVAIAALTAAFVATFSPSLLGMVAGRG